ncbi:MAG: SDR family NAD(P)-dependent oxidoreductase [Anaerolineales bacterium]
MKVNGKVVLVTGGGSGIGRALVLDLLSRGASVAAIDIDKEGLDKTVQLAGDKQDRLSSHIADITDRTAVEALPEKVIAIHGAIDGLINNAGIIQPFVRVNDLEYDAIQRVMNVNFFGTINVTKTFLPYLLERSEAHIVSMSSMGGFLPVPGQTVYGASKAAIKLFTEGLHSELMDTNVHVTVIFQGSTNTNIAQNSGLTDLPGDAQSAEDSGFKVMTPEDAARQILDAMEKNKYQAAVGSDASMMYLLSRLAPKQAAKLIFNQMKSLLPDK